MMKTERPYITRKRCFSSKRSGFTLIEMMIALGLLVLMLAIIFIPLNQAFSAFRIGQARSELQQAGRQTLDQMARELRTAVRVFPNDVLPGVTDSAPYNALPPYLVQGSDCDDTGANDRVANTSRIDFIPADVDGNGDVVTPLRPGKYLVTYYARRVRPTDAYDPISNPVVLFRAQSPIKRWTGGITDPVEIAAPNGSTWSTGPRNVDTSASRYEAGTCDNRGSRWLYQNNLGEPIAFTGANSTTLNDAGVVAAAETQLSPRGMSLTMRQLVAGPTDLKPNSWFTPEDSNSDGKIDRVTISLSLDRIDAGTMARSNPEPDPNANPSSGNGLHRVRLPLVVDLPNVM